jgi:nucleotide-binding universal stress UspA family protein
MAKHTKGAMMELFMGSVTTYVIHHCKSPVFVLLCA